MERLQSIDLGIPERLLDEEFRREWFRAELESSVPEAFRDLREARGMTQGDLAKAMNTKQPAVSRFERSTNAVWDFDFLLRMAEALDARLKVVIEPAETVLHEYSPPLELDGEDSALLHRLASQGPLGQRGGASALNATGKNSNETNLRGSQPGGILNQGSVEQRTALRSGRGGQNSAPL